MKIIIHRGTNQIGGCITEIQSNIGTKIIIDIGTNLPNLNGEIKPEIKLEGLNYGEEPKYNGVIVTHYHGDHIGLYKNVLEGIPIYTGKITKDIFLYTQNYLAKAGLVSKEDIEKINNFKTYEIPNKIKDIPGFVITPIRTDHAAFDSHMLLIECDGKKLLHTGDFRTHGMTGQSVMKAIQKYVGKVDCLIIEGTMFSRENENVESEYNLRIKAQNTFEDNKSIFAFCSSTNIDRIAGFHKAASSARKMFIVDRYQYGLLKYISSIAKSDYYKFDNNIYFYKDNLLDIMKKDGFIMLARANDFYNMLINQFPEGKILYSQWLGYLKSEDPKHKKLQEIIPKDSKEYIYLHTSGHATKEAIKEVIDLTKPNAVIPIHTEQKKKIQELTNNAVILEDGEEFIII